MKLLPCLLLGFFLADPALLLGQQVAEPAKEEGLVGKWKQSAPPGGKATAEILATGQFTLDDGDGAPPRSGVVRFQNGKPRLILRGEPVPPTLAWDGPSFTLRTADGHERTFARDEKAAAPASPVGKPIAKLPLDEKTIGQLIKSLESDNFQTRQKAQGALQQLAKDQPDGIKAASMKAMDEAKDPEARVRLRSVLYQLAQDKLIAEPQAFLGIQMLESGFQGADNSFIGAISVQSVLPDSAALKAGVQEGDLITKIDGRNLEVGRQAVTEFQKYVKNQPPGKAIELKILRNNQEITLRPQLGQRPKELADLRLPAEEAELFEKWLGRERGQSPSPK